MAKAFSTPHFMWFLKQAEGKMPLDSSFEDALDKWASFSIEDKNNWILYFECYIQLDRPDIPLSAEDKYKLNDLYFKKKFQIEKDKQTKNRRILNA